MVSYAALWSLCRTLHLFLELFETFFFFLLEILLYLSFNGVYSFKNRQKIIAVSLSVLMIWHGMVGVF